MSTEIHRGTEYVLRLVSGRIVLPGPGGFYWYGERGRGLGSSMNADWVIAEMAAGSLTGVGIVNVYGCSKSVIEFIPLAQIESVQTRSV